MLAEIHCRRLHSQFSIVTIVSHGGMFISFDNEKQRKKTEMMFNKWDPGEGWQQSSFVQPPFRSNTMGMFMGAWHLSARNFCSSKQNALNASHQPLLSVSNQFITQRILKLTSKNLEIAISLAAFTLLFLGPCSFVGRFLPFGSDRLLFGCCC